MLFPDLVQFEDLGIFLLRVFVAIVFLSSGWGHIAKNEKRAKSFGMSLTVTFMLGVGEIAGGLLVLLGIFTQLGAIILIGVMIGAIYKKIFVWKTGFWGEKSMGWHYDLFFVIANLVILFTGGGGIVLMQL